MSRRDDIERRAERIRERQGKGVFRETSSAQEKSDARVDEMRQLAGQFATWASYHGIPYDRYAGRFKTKGRWTLARRITNEEKGSYEELEVDSRGTIDANLGHNPTQSRENSKIAGFWPGLVDDRIAELCVEHGVEWDM